MSTTPVERPIVRSFKSRFSREAAAHARAGGHSIVWESDSRAHLVLPVPDTEDPGDLAEWSLLDLGKKRWTVEERGTFKGLATALVPRDCLAIVKRRAERDSIHPGPKRVVHFDCLECGACCRDNEVQLFPKDLARFKKAGREDLTKAPLARKRDGKLVLTLLKSKACRHLATDNKCGIYEIRPDACSMFPVASECCLFARESEMGLVDGLEEGD